MPNEEQRDYLSRAEAAELLGRDIRTIDRYRRTEGPDGKPLLTTYQRPGVQGVSLDREEVERLRHPVPVT
jgi:hypothetical protein